MFGTIQDVWDNSQPSRTVCSCSRPFGTVRNCSQLFATVHDCLGPFGTIQAVGTVRNPWQLSRTLQDCLRPFGTIWDRSGPSRNVQDHSGPFRNSSPPLEPAVGSCCGTGLGLVRASYCTVWLEKRVMSLLVHKFNASQVLFFLQCALARGQCYY